MLLAFVCNNVNNTTACPCFLDALKASAENKANRKPSEDAYKGEKNVVVQAQKSSTGTKGETVTSKGQGQDTVDGGEDGDELVKETRVKFREWDPVCNLSVIGKLF